MSPGSPRVARQLNQPLFMRTLACLHSEATRLLQEGLWRGRLTTGTRDDRREKCPLPASAPEWLLATSRRGADLESPTRPEARILPHMHAQRASVSAL